MTPTQQSLYEARKARIARIVGAGIEQRPAAPKFVPVVIKEVEPPPPPPPPPEPTPPWPTLDILRTELWALVEEAANCGAGPADHGITVPDINRAVAGHFGLTLHELTCSRQFRRLARPRQIAMYLARILTRRSFPQIARLIGDRDHTTIMHGSAKIAALIKSDAALRSDIEAIHARLKGVR